MADLSKIVSEKLSRLNSVPDEFVSVIDKHQKKVFAELTKLLDELERKDGVILVTQKNIAQVERIITQLREVFFDKEYIKALTDFASEFDTQAKITDAMYKAGFDEVPDEKIFSQIMRVSKRNALELFGENAIDQEFFEPLRRALTTAVTTGASFKDTITTIRDLTLGNDQTEGLLQSHSKTYARTSFSVADRAYTMTVASSYEIEFYKYSGSAIETTRPFCETRHNKFYHKKEVESWGELEPWAGWMKGTNSSTIFQNLGGWNCRHSLIPVSVFSVPKADVLRAISKGYYSPDQKTREKLGIAA